MRGENLHRGMFLLARMLTVPSVVNSAANGENIGPTTTTVWDEQGVGVASQRDRKKVEVVGTDNDASTFRERHGHDWSTDRQPRGVPRLPLQAVATARSAAHTDADPPVKPLQHAQCARGAKLARNGRMVRFLHPTAHE